MQESDFQECTRVAQEFSYIKDPTAIPYLAKFVKSKEISYAIYGLMRIGTDEALEAMIPATDRKYDKDAAKTAKELLWQRVSRIRDPIIREKAMDAIK